MCGWYVRRSDKQRLAEAFRLSQQLDDLAVAQGRNVVPTTVQPVIRMNRDTGERELAMMRWGLVTGSVCEAALRCAGGWIYEWKTDGKEKQPFAFTLKSGEPLAFGARGAGGAAAGVPAMLRPYVAEEMRADACNPAEGKCAESWAGEAGPGGS